MLKLLYRRAQLKGLLGGSRGWTAVWTVLFLARMVKKASSREPKVVYTEVLRPGETVVIRHEDAVAKRRRR